MTLPEEMYQCPNCGSIYSPDRGDPKGKVAAGTRFEVLPEDWQCPGCGAGAKMFCPLVGPGSSTTQKGSCQPVQ